jgi:hypothetical protein
MLPYSRQNCVRSCHSGQDSMLLLRSSVVGVSPKMSPSLGVFCSADFFSRISRTLTAAAVLAAVGFMTLLSAGNLIARAGEREAWLDRVFSDTAPRPPRSVPSGTTSLNASRTGIVRHAPFRRSEPIRSEPTRSEPTRSEPTDLAKHVATRPNTIVFPPVTPLE